MPELRGIVLAGYWKLPRELQNCRPCRAETSSGAKNENKMSLNVKPEPFKPFFSAFSMIEVSMICSNYSLFSILIHIMAVNTLVVCSQSIRMILTKQI